MASWFDWLAKCENAQWQSHVHVDCCWNVFLVWAESLKNKTDKSILKAFAKFLNRSGLKKTLFFANGPWSRVRQQTLSKFTFFGTKSRNKIFQHRANDQNTFASNLAILHIQKQLKIRRRASRFSRSYIATFHRSVKRSDHKWLSHNQPAIVQQIGQAHCSLSHYKQIFMLPVKIVRNASAFVFVFFLKVLSRLSLHHVRQTAVSNLCSRTSFRLSQHEKRMYFTLVMKYRLLYISASLTPFSHEDHNASD